MSEEEDAAHKKDPLTANVRKRATRHRNWLREGEPTIARRLAQIGVLGWIIVLPTLLGILIGRWLDETSGTAIFWTAPLMFGGLILGCWSAWRWMNSE